MRILILDNYDSFTFNLYQLAAGLSDSSEPIVRRNDQITLKEIEDLAPDRILISPGPGHPADPAYFGVCREVIRELGPQIPILGICLGHLGIAEAFGGKIIRTSPCHGRSSPIHHAGTSVFRGLPDPLDGMRYHSLSVERNSLPDCFELIAWTGDGLVMGIRHREHPLVGLQFHPESIGTPDGRDLLAAFLADQF